MLQTVGSLAVVTVPTPVRRLPLDWQVPSVCGRPPTHWSVS